MNKVMTFVVGLLSAILTDGMAIAQVQPEQMFTDPILPSVGSRLRAGLEPTTLTEATADDWPMWGYGPGRGAVTPHELPAGMVLKWVRRFPSPAPAWPGEVRLHFDIAYPPVVLGRTVYVGLHTDKVVALDSDSGKEKWSFFAGGPIRLAPVAWRGRLLLASDDGYLYCLDATNGNLL
jgi:PQQ-like domain